MKRPGFTLIEVTLSIVIGIILIAGATLLYNQAKLGAGNTRARAKVVALQGLVEEMMANAGGTLPGDAGLYAAWVQRRPDDNAQSPWGGAAGVGSGGWVFYRPGFRAAVNSAPGSIATGSSPYVTGDVEYATFVAPGTAYIQDLAAGQVATVSQYTVSAVDNGGNYHWFVTGGK